MNSVNRTIASALRAVSFATVSALTTASALAGTGSTDIYAPRGVAASFGFATARSDPARDYQGSTGIYDVKGFLASFGPAGAVIDAETVGTGSTDVYGADGFLISFGKPAYRTEDDLTVAR